MNTTSVGRKFRPGSDYAGAEAAYRAAINLDPDDKTNIANLAVLLEHNHWGLRFGPGARFKEALAEYRKLTLDKLSEFGMQNNISFDLYYDGQFAEAKAAAEVLKPQPLGLIVACEAALHGSPASLEEARRRTGSDQQFKEVTSSAGQMLINLRKYSQGADLEEAGASGDTASDTAAYAALYRKTVPREQLKFSDDPSGAALRFTVLTDDPGLTLDQLRSVSSRNGARVLVTSNVLDWLVKEAKGTLSEKARHSDFADVGFDLQITRAQPKIEGNDSIGYKVVLWPSYSKSSRYIVKEDGHYKLLGTSRDDEGVGLEVLDRIAADDLAGARALLDWLRDDWHLAGGDDPLSGAAFPRLWTKGKDADAATMKLAAASILTDDKQTAPQGLAMLGGGQGFRSQRRREGKYFTRLADWLWQSR